MNENKPQSIGIIMDGNRRFAREKGWSVSEGHLAGYENLKNVVNWGKELNIEHIIAFCFSTENWNREKAEVSSLMNLFRFALKEVVNELGSFRDVNIKIIGNKEKFPVDIQNIIDELNKRECLQSITVHLALSYGGRDEIVRAARKASLDSGGISEGNFSKYLDTANVPDPDLIIRTGGEMRLSNFLPWQCVYSELFFTETLWPAFTKDEFASILDLYGKRKRNFGA